MCCAVGNVVGRDSVVGRGKTVFDSSDSYQTGATKQREKTVQYSTVQYSTVQYS